MQILIAAATESEIAPFFQTHPSADILVTGVGTPAAIYHLAKRIQQIDYDLVIQAGIAGSFLRERELAKVVMVHKDTFADIGVNSRDGFTNIFESGLAEPDHQPYNNGWLVNPWPLPIGLEKVTGITVNMITDDVGYTNRLSGKYSPTIESMEGAALHYVCLHEEVPFLQLRAISNYVGERDKSKWMMKESIENLNKELEAIYKKMLHETISR